MRRYLLDTGIAGDFINRRRGVHEHASVEVARGNRIGIGVPVLAELAYGIEHSVSRDRNMERLWNALPAWKVWPSGCNVNGSLYKPGFRSIMDLPVRKVSSK